MSNLLPFVVLGIALGSVFALSGLGIVVLYRTTGVLNFAGGATGALGALVAWTLLEALGLNEWVAYLGGILTAAFLTLLYGVTVGRGLAHRDPLTKAMGTIGLLLALLGLMSLVWNPTVVRTMPLPTTAITMRIGPVVVNGTQIVALVLALVVCAATAVFLKRSKLGTAMRAMADDRTSTAILGVPVRSVEATTWFVSGLLAGVSGLLLSNLVNLNAVDLTFLVIPALAVALVAMLRSVWVCFAAGLAIGLIQSLLTPVLALSPYRSMTPFVVAVVAVLWMAWRRPNVERIA